MEPESYAEFVDDYAVHHERRQRGELRTWVERYPQAILLPVPFVRHIAKDEEIFKAQRTEHEYLLSLAAQIANRGLEEPIVLKVDHTLKCALKDGNHRLISFMMLGYDAIPTIVKIQEMGIKGYGVNLGMHPEYLFRVIEAGRSGVVD